MINIISVVGARPNFIKIAPIHKAFQKHKEAIKHLIGTDWDRLIKVANEILNGNIKQGSIPQLWDGNAAERIVEIILKKMG